MVRIGLVGAGGMGNVHYQNYQYVEDCEVVAIVGASENDKNNAEKWKLPIFDSIDAMCQEVDLDVVDICTPTFLHFNHVMSALKNKKHTICEKPLCLKVDLAKEMFQYAKEQGCYLYVGHVVQFMNQTRILRELIENKTFGNVLDGYFERLSEAPKWAQGSWLFEKEKSGLIPFDLHIHDLDVIISLFGKPKQTGFTSCGTNGNYEEQYRFFYTYDNKNIVAEAAWLNAKIPFTARWRIYFEHGYIVNDGEQLIAYPEEGEAIVYDIEEKRKVSTGINVPPTGMFLEELEHFVHCVRDERPSQIITEEQVLEVIGLLEKII